MYDLEGELIRDFLEKKNCIERLQTYDQVREFRYNSGKADIILVRYNEKILKRRIKAGLKSPILQKRNIQVLYHFLQNKNLSEESLSKNLNGVNLKKNIEHLLSQFYIVKENGFYKISKSYKLHVNEVIAIEAKIKNWKKALEQANKTRSFASKRYILLDESFSKPAIRNIKLLRKLNIGLITQGDDCPDFILNPKTIQPYSLIQQLLLNETHFAFWREKNVCS